MTNPALASEWMNQMSGVFSQTVYLFVFSLLMVYVGACLWMYIRTIAAKRRYNRSLTASGGGF